MASDHEEGQQIKPRRKRWGVAPSNAEPSHVASHPSLGGGGGAALSTVSTGAPPIPASSNHQHEDAPNKSSSSPSAPQPTNLSSSSSSQPIGGDAKAKALATHESIRARLAAIKAAKQQAGAAGGALAVVRVAPVVTGATMGAGSKRGADAAGVITTTTTTTETSRDNQAKRARHYDVDFSVVPGPPRTGTAVFAAAAAATAGTSIATSRQQQQQRPSLSAATTTKKVNPYLAHVFEARKAKQAADKMSVSRKKKNVPKGGDVSSSAAATGTDATDDIHVPQSEIDGDGDDDEGYDPVLALVSRTDASRKRGRREIRFVEPGKWQEVAQKKREIAARAEAAGYVSGRKVGHTITSSTMAAGGGDYYYAVSSGLEAEVEDDVALPRADAVPEADGMPLVCEWWDLALLPAKLKKEVASMEDKAVAQQAKEAMQHLEGPDGSAAASFEGDASNGHDDRQSLRSRCYQEASLVHCKTSSLVQHIVPIQPPRSAAAEKQPVLHLTKKELKRQRKLRRQARQRELQDMQAAGLMPAPEPRLTLQNFIQVMGDQAYLDPSKIEQKVQEQMEARQRAHMERNEANRLTKEQRAAKRARKYHEDTSEGVVVAVYYVLDTSHPFLRAKIDLNAQQNNVSGGVLECEVPRLSCVICEGGPKAIKRYRRLMEVRMKWTGPNDGEGPPAPDDANDADEGAAPKFNPDNRCELVWQGMAVKRHFKGFVFQACETADQARAVLKSKGVAHYWDQVLEHHKAGRSSASLQLRLAADSTSESDQDENEDDDEDIVMKDSEEP